MKKVTFLFMVLFVALWVSNGCRKDEIQLIESKSQHKILKYNPVFDTISLQKASSFTTNDSIVVVAPGYNTIQSFFNDMKNIWFDNPYALAVRDIYNEGYRWEADLATIQFGSNMENYIICVPLIKDSTAEYLSVKRVYEGKIDYSIVPKSATLNFVQNNEELNPDKNHWFLAANHFNLYDYVLQQDINVGLNDWIENQIDFVNSGLRGCYGTWVVYYGFYRMSTGEAGAATTGWVLKEIVCDEMQGDDWVSTTPNFIPPWDPNNNIFAGGTNNPYSGMPFNDIILEILPGIDPECLNFILPGMKNEIIELVNGMQDNCFKGNFQQQLIQNFNEECMKAKAMQGDLSNGNVVEMWEFTSLISESNNSFFGFTNIIDQSQDPISASNRICPDGIIVTPSSWQPNLQNVAGISGLQVSLNNGSVNLTFENLFFDVDQPKNCNYPTQQLIADAINSAISIANNNLFNNVPIYSEDNLFNQNVQFTRLIELQIRELGSNAGCTYEVNGRPSFFSGSVTPSNYENGVGLDCHKGATFINFSNLTTGPGC